MKTLLAFDTSAAHCTAAVICGARITAHRFEPMEKGQAERLIPMLEDLLAETGLAWGDLNALGVGTGPGNFTGVRIAVAAARGLALSLGIPAIGVTRLEALAYGLPRPLWVIEDARRGDVYAQRFDSIDSAAKLTQLNKLTLDAPATGNVLPNALPSLPIAEAIARIAITRNGKADLRPSPFYLRSTDATPPSDPPPMILP